MPRYSASQTSPFGLRRASGGTNRKLSKLELLFVAFAVLALACLGSLGPKPDPWLETAKAELQSPPLTCSTCRTVQAYRYVDQRFVAPPDSAAAVRAISGSALFSEVAEPMAAVTSSAAEVPKAIENSPSEIATVKVHQEAETSSPDSTAARPNLQVQRRAKPTEMSAPERLSTSRYHQVPRGTEKMFDQNWQNRAFSYQ